jgi:hypothetical protein
MAAIDILKKNLDIAYSLPQVIDQIIRVAVSQVDLIHVSQNIAVMKSLTSETLVKLQHDDTSFLDPATITAEARRIKQSLSESGTQTPASEEAVQVLNNLTEVIDAQRAISHLTVSQLCTSIEAYCKDRFTEITGESTKQNVSNLAGIFTLFTVHTKALKMIPDLRAFDTILRAKPIDVDSLNKCFAYRHAIVHRAAVLDKKAVTELGMPDSEIGKVVERFSLTEINALATAIYDTGLWLDENTKM